MKLCIRAHDLGVKGTANIVSRLDTLKIDGIQLVCYKCLDDVPYLPGGITEQKARLIGKELAEANAFVPLIGAYFNPVHSDKEKVRRCKQVFAEYLRFAVLLGCDTVGSETGSFNDDKWTYHPENRTEKALMTVVSTFRELCDTAAEHQAYVAMEGAAGHVCYDVATLDKAIKLIDRKNIKVIFDLYNYLDESNQHDYLDILDEGLKTFNGRILLFHMKDCFFKNGEKPTQAPFGKGEMDIRAVLKRIKNYDENAVLTLEGTTGDDIKYAVDTIKDIWESV